MARTRTAQPHIIRRTPTSTVYAAALICVCITLGAVVIGLSVEWLIHLGWIVEGPPTGGADVPKVEDVSAGAYLLAAFVGCIGLFLTVATLIAKRFAGGLANLVLLFAAVTLYLLAAP
jgi:hypothetical protein